MTARGAQGSSLCKREQMACSLGWGQAAGCGVQPEPPGPPPQVHAPASVMSCSGPGTRGSEKRRRPAVEKLPKLAADSGAGAGRPCSDHKVWADLPAGVRATILLGANGLGQ